MSSSAFSPSRGSPVASRLQREQHFVLIGSSRLRSSSLRKPPEPLRRAIADCLSSSASASGSAGGGAVAGLHHGSPSVVLNDASRTLRDYLASPATTDLAYCVILEHTIAERERSPAVVARCVGLLKRYLIRYKPSEETLLQIDRFCVNTISECDNSASRRSATLSQSTAQQSVASAHNLPSLPVSSFASGALVKSLNYIRSLVAQHIPKRSFQPAAFAGSPSASRQALPALSSFLRKSFNSQLSPANNVESSDIRDAATLPVSHFSKMEKVDVMEDIDHIAYDALNWRWAGDHRFSVLSTESDRASVLEDMRTHTLLELGAAALLVGDMEAKMKNQPWKYFGTADMPYLDQLLQPSSVSTITISASARSHLRAITASKRCKAEPHQIWEDSPLSTFRPRARPLFQYRHYSEQQPLRLNPAEVCEVIAAVGSEAYTPMATPALSSRLSNNTGKPSMDVAVSVLIKLIIDMYVLDPGTAAPLTLSMLEEMLLSPKAACRVRAFDLILNLGVHAHLLEPMMVGDTTTIEEEYAQESFLETEDKLPTPDNRKTNSVDKMDASSAIYKFESWILNILYETLLLLVQTEEHEESVWASALSCLLYFVCDRGKILRDRLEGLDIRVIKAFIMTSRTNSWAEIVHSKLISMLTNIFYQIPDESVEAVLSSPVFLIDQIDLIGGIEFIFIEYSLANLREDRRNLYLVLFDYVLHQINQACATAGVSEYSNDEIQPLATLFSLVDAPEAFYISVKLGVEGIAELLRRSISTALARYSNNERLNMLLKNITETFDMVINSFTRVDKDFFHLIQVTKRDKFLEGIQSESPRNGIVMKAKLSWATLHSLLHSDRIACRQNGYIWLGDLLISEISEGKEARLLSNIIALQHKIMHAGVCDDMAAAADVPLSIWLMCGLLKSKHNVIRWGFLFVIDRFLMRCKFLLDENEMQHSGVSNVTGGDADSRLEKANAVVDIMSSALSLVAQINETDRFNILKMCDILFSQLCLKVHPLSAMPYGEHVRRDVVHVGMEKGEKVDSNDHISQPENHSTDISEERNSKFSYSTSSSLVRETASMAAMLLQGRAIVPMQLVARVPAALFYWPLIQLAGAATDDIALGVAVGSKGRGNLPGAASDIRATLLLLLIGKCTVDPSAFEEVGGEEFFRELLDDTDSRVAYYSSAFLLKRMMTEKPDEYQHMLQNLIFKAQQSNNEKLLENPYLQMRGILQLSNYGLI
ncbi:unnamed protein product [Linum trigynum]|uniref:Uncharacterized protein n=1 Tax=Linum trigynum TaxID=586398 RepID=A0AAV2DNK3_9ROSI